VRAADCGIEPLENRLLFAVFNVNSTADILNPPPGVVTLRSAIQQANATPGGNTINLTVAGVYKITLRGTAGENDNAAGEFAVLPGSGGASFINTSGGYVVVDANQLSRAFDINPNFDPANPAPAFSVLMQGFTIENGSASDAGNPDGSNATGGGIRDQGNASLTLTNMTVTANTATADGGGIGMENAVSARWSLILNNTTISDNHAGDAGGGIESDGSGTVSVNAGSIITANTALNQGGGIWLDAVQGGNAFQSANLDVSGARISDNASLTSVAGGIGNAGNGVVNITASTISGNRAAMQGGGLADFNAQASWTLTQALVSNNFSGTNGGGIASASPILSIVTSQFQGNQAAQSGGAIFANGTTLKVSRSTFCNNVAGVGGGAVETQTFGTGAVGSSIIESTLADNSAVGIFSPTTGGGIDAGSGFTGTLTLLNDTISGNVADDGGGVFWAGTAGSSLTVQNTAIAANRANVTGPDVNNSAGSVTDLGGNLIGIAGAGSGNVGFTSTSTITGSVSQPKDPDLGLLANNFGPLAGDAANAVTLLTMAPGANSPLIGHGLVSAAPATDERGFPNFVGGLTNIGAVSAGAVTLNLSYFLTLSRNFGKPGTFATGDLNGDGTVNLADLLLLTRNFGRSLSAPPMTPAAAVDSPETPAPLVRRRSSPLNA